MSGDELITKYTNWVKDNSFVRNITNDTYVITTPFTDSQNDHIDLYVKKTSGDAIQLSDDGYTVSDLTMNGTDIFSTPRRRKTFEMTLNRYGVKFDPMTYELLIEATPTNIAARKHSMLQAVMAVNDLYVISRENVSSFFKEDIEAYLRLKEVVFSKSIKLPGKTGFDHNVDFIVPHSNSRPERLIQAINVPKKDQVMSAIFAFNDIAAVREEPNERMVIYNDEIREISADSKKALDEYDISIFQWSKKEELAEALALV